MSRMLGRSLLVSTDVRVLAACVRLIAPDAMLTDYIG